MWAEDTVEEEPSSSSQQSTPHRSEAQPRVGGGQGSDGDVGELRENALYQAIQPYTPTAQGEIALLQDDTVRIIRICQNGWVRALNTRTRDSGFIPAATLKCLPVPEAAWRSPLPPPDIVPHNGPDYLQYTPQVPPKSGPSSAAPATHEPFYVELMKKEREETGQGDLQGHLHRLVDVFFDTPILCKLCK
ncbi:Sorbin and SH3 domain-containing protein 1-like protein [Frankliniella fusca]|uniref:Sorbin and SH3 domain-containing protein 1-like protein n=1 Tax=Frankliniella fusca TaxID=407009 RepID=A0AAE1I043_9NEOP|nr:Sorbin and SH3 domain-containing protein 1-like protein [Frankliniella fusca]